MPITLEELQKSAKKGVLNDDEIHDFAVAALAVLRGNSRGDILKVIRKMRKMMG